MNPSPARRQVLKAALGGLATMTTLASGRSFAVQQRALSGGSLGTGQLSVVGDGAMTLPVNFQFPDDALREQAMALLRDHGMSTEERISPLNVTVWQSDERIVLFDTGAGTRFLDGTGLLLDALAEIGVDPYDVTDVVFTHAHPDHLWGVLDDFDDLAFPDAVYHMHGTEFDYWMSDNTLADTPESRKTFVVGAQSRLPLIEAQLNRFDDGDEILPGIECMVTPGHTPGHTAFALHSSSDDAVMVLGDALTHPVFSFARPDMPMGSDLNAQQAADTRRRLLDRLAGDRMLAVGYHLPNGGLGRVVVDGSVWRWEAVQ